MHQAVIDLVHRPGEFAPDQIMRDVGGQPQVGKTVEQMQREEQVGGHAVAMGFDMHRNAGLVGEAAPAFDAGECNPRSGTAARPAAD